jgi:hypothetical protein
MLFAPLMRKKLLIVLPKPVQTLDYVSFPLQPPLPPLLKLLLV